MDPKVGKKEIEEIVERVLSEAKMPVSPSYVAERLKVGWGTARAILLNMTLKGKVRMISTNITSVFCLFNAREEVKQES